MKVSVLRLFCHLFVIMLIVRHFNAQESPPPPPDPNVSPPPPVIFSPPPPGNFSPPPPLPPVPAPNNGGSQPESRRSKGLSGGQKAGIVIGVLLAVGAAGFGAMVCMKRQSNVRRARLGQEARRAYL